jgi:mandelamide amidase
MPIVLSSPLAFAASKDDAINLTTKAAAEYIQKGEMKAEDYAVRLLAHADKHKELNAWVVIDRARVLEEARAVDQARTRGEKLKLLSGVPFAVKDQIDVSGYPTTAGNGALKKYVPNRSAPVVQRLVDAGGIVFGKTTCPDMTGGGHLMMSATSHSRFFGKVRNPYNPDHGPGGSSGGNGVAIAARMVPCGIGEDTGGSVRFPAAFCGIAGLRPSTYTVDLALGNGKAKRYSDEGIVPPPGFRETFGPMARTVADCAFLDELVTGERTPQVNLRAVKLGIPNAGYWDNDFVDQDVARVMRESFAKLRSAGATLVEIDFESLTATGAALDPALRHFEKPADFATWLKANTPGITFEEIYAGVKQPAARAPSKLSDAQARAMLSSALDTYAAIFKTNGIAAVLSPTMTIPAPPLAAGVEAMDQKMMVNGKPMTEVEVIIKNIFWGPRLGVPGLNVPAGLARGLPVGLALEGLPGTDSRILGLGIAVENVLGALPAPPLLSA